MKPAVRAEANISRAKCRGEKVADRRSRALLVGAKLLDHSSIRHLVARAAAVADRQLLRSLRAVGGGLMHRNRNSRFLGPHSLAGGCWVCIE